MILKAYIIELPKKDDNIFKVRIPFMEDNTTNEMVFKALLCNQPGDYKGYRVGDCVFVSFENDKLNTAIILGKLFIEEEEEVPTYRVINELKVTSKISLPNNTTIGGYSANDFFSMQQNLDKINSGAILSEPNLLYDVISEWTDEED